MVTDSKKRLALAIIDYLNTSVKDGTLLSDDAESIEIATGCIAEAFHVDPSDKKAMDDALGGQNLHSIYNVYEKLKGKTSGAEGSTSSSSGPSSGNTSSPANKDPSSANPAPTTTTPESETLKGKGNAAMQKKDYPAAVEAYTSALELVPLNPIYLSNRAAAFSAMNEHQKAKNDAEMATAADPNYTKAWSRLGLAKFALGDARGSMEAYQRGIQAEGKGGSEAMKKGFETAKRRVEEEEGQDAADSAAAATTNRDGDAGAGGAGGMPDLSALAGMFGGGGAGGGGGGGGMPDLSSLMQNPMMRSMAQNMMSNPDMMNNLMNNPTLRNMASNFGGGGGGAGGAGRGGAGGGGMPDLGALMNDPSIAEMARNLMGGGAGRGGGGAGQ